MFVHGAWHGAWCWDALASWFTDRGWSTHAVDLRGHGATPVAGSLRWIATKDYVADLAEVVAGLERPPVLVGHSMGGLVVQRYLEGRSDVPGAVLLAPDPVNGVLGATVRVARRHPLRFLAANATLSMWPLVSSPERAREMFFAADMAPEEVAVHWDKLQDESFRAYLDMIFRRPKPQLVATPVLVIGGRDDRIFTPTEMARTAAAYGTEALVIEGAAHDLMLGGRWPQVAAAMAAWLEDQAVS